MHGRTTETFFPQKNKNKKTKRANKKENRRTEETFDILRGVNDDEEVPALMSPTP